MPGCVATKRPSFQGHVLLILATAMMLLLAGYWVDNRRAAWVAEDWRRGFAELPDERLPSRLRQAADLGQDGLALLVEGLFSSRDGLAAASADVLDEELHRWMALPHAETLARRTCLAESLADRAETGSELARQRAAELAEHLLAWPGDADAPAMRVVLACQRIFSARPAPSSKLR
jgi:hypothetical protein